MKYLLNSSLICVLLLLASINCDSPTENGSNTENLVKISGRVINSETSEPLDNAVVKVVEFSPSATTITDSSGQYLIEITVEQEQSVSVAAIKETFAPDTTEVVAIPGREINIPDFKLQPTQQIPVVSGNAASIILASQSADHIGVRESGSPETARLVFQVHDSTGIPIDLLHTVNVRFRIGAGPGGGEFLFPPSTFTDHQGNAEVQITSGTKAGVVQVIAEVPVDTGIIRSKPIPIAIHGGLPDAAHFSLAVEKLNFPGWHIFGLTNRMTAYVGDKYSNPVRPNTNVYFSSTGGIIEGSSLTNLQGSCSVDLISASPQPVHPTLGAGFATVTARTVDENQNIISTDAIVLFSGYPTLSISPTSFSIPNLGFQNFVYTVQDQNGNPLSEGTSVSVAVDGDGIDILGTTEVNLPDTQSDAWTIFSFTIAEVDSSVQSRPVLIEITTVGPNGGAIIGIGGTAE